MLISTSAFWGVPLVLCAAVLLLSGAMKLTDGPGTRDAFTSLRLPSWLVHSPAPALLPWGEIALGVLLLVLPGGWLVGATLATVALFVAYLVVVARALGFAQPVTCHCFGTLGERTLSRRTLLRNGVLVGTAVLAVVAAIAGISVPAVVLGAPLDFVGVVAMAALTGAVALLVLGHGPTGEATGSFEPGDRLPWFNLRDVDTGADVRPGDFGEDRTLLLFMSPGCGPCERVAADLPTLRDRLPGTRVRVVLPDQQASSLAGWAGGAATDGGLLDPGGNVRTLQGWGTPTALLLTRDGRLAAPVAVGALAIGDLVDDLAGTGTPSSEPTPSPAPVATPEPDELDYVRAPIPDAVVRAPGGELVTLQELARERAQLLVSVSCHCSGSDDATLRTAAWATRLPVLDTAVLSAMPTEEVRTADGTRILYDHGGLARRGLAMHGNAPQAVLIGADGLIAGGPVQGVDAIEEFVATIESQLAEEGVDAGTP